MGKCGELAIGPENILVKNLKGTWVAQSMKCPTLDFCSGHDLRVLGSSPVHGVGSALSVESAWDSFSLSLCTPPLSACAHSCSLACSLSQ